MFVDKDKFWGFFHKSSSLAQLRSPPVKEFHNLGPATENVWSANVFDLLYDTSKMILLSDFARVLVLYVKVLIWIYFDRYVGAVLWKHI